jgi:PAS domain S-box-containing protein
VENANDAIFLTEVQPNRMPGRFIMVNRVACQRSGYSYDELMQMSIRDLVVPDTSSKISDVGKKLLQDNRAVFEATHRRKDGTTFPVETSIHLFEMGGQRVSLTFSRDITERKATEAALRESELLLHEVFDNANDAIFLLERTSAGPGKYLLVNEKAVRMLSYIKEELLTMSPRDIVPEEIQKKVMPAVIKKLLTDSHATFESAHRRKDGSIYPIEVSTHTFHYGGKDVDLSLVRDITERKQSEETLQKSEEKYRTLFESAGDIIFIHNREMRILAFNTFACERLGYTNQELQSMTIELVDSPEDTLHAPDRMARLVENGHLSFETKHRRKDGTLIPIMVSARMITWEGKPAVMSICHDITDLKRAEGALRQANGKLTLLSGITRHDINNQLTILIGFLTILEKKQNDPTIRKFFVKPITAAQRIVAMIQFTREYEEIGTNEPAWQGCRTLVTIAGQQAPLGDIILKNDLPRTMELFADPLTLKVFYNLLDNAARYGGKISTIRFLVEKSEKDRIIVCEDNGDGVPVKDKERIFYRGFGKNTGLGLALSREILDITGISIRENGEPGKGARFEITVPKGACRSNTQAGSGPGTGTP